VHNEIQFAEITRQAAKLITGYMGLYVYGIVTGCCGGK
jgi:hypothetical protein